MFNHFCRVVAANIKHAILISNKLSQNITNHISLGTPKLFATSLGSFSTEGGGKNNSSADTW
jgi:hypothetical protein